MDTTEPFENPFKPGAGHMPPHLAGRQNETREFSRLLGQKTILENPILTGLRGVGKTVLAERLKPIARESGWVWVGSDWSESTSISEERVAVRIITDLSIATASIVLQTEERNSIGFVGEAESIDHTLSYHVLKHIHDTERGLTSDKLRAVLEFAWAHLDRSGGTSGVIFCYDEAQNMSDQAKKEEYPVALLLDVFQSIQRKGIPFMLMLVGLPTLFPKLVESRTFAERMFRVLMLTGLSAEDSREAIEKPIEATQCPVELDKQSIDLIVNDSGGYPYFIQFICKETYDAFILGAESVPISAITHKLDIDFFSGRWARATDRQKELLRVIAHLDVPEGEFSVQEVTQKSKEMLPKPFGASHTNQMLVTLGKNGLVYKNRHGKYMFAVPLLANFILRQE